MRWYHKLQTRLTASFIFLSITPVIVLTVLFVQRSTSLLYSNARSHVVERSQYLASEIDNLLTNHLRLLTYVTESEGITQDLGTSLQGLLSLDESLEEVALIGGDGIEAVRFSRRVAILPDDLRDLSSSTAFQAIVAGQEVYFSPIRITDTGEPLMTVALPVFNRRTGDLTHVLTANFRFQVIWNLLADEIYREGEIAYVIDGAGEVVAHPNPSVVLSGTRITLPEQPDAAWTGLSNQPVIYAQETVPIVGGALSVIAEQETAVAFVLLEELLLSAGVALVLVAAGISLAALFVVRRIVWPLTHLANVAGMIAGGDHNLRAEVRGKDEIAQVGAAFNQMTEQLQISIEQLSESLRELIEVEMALRQKHFEIDSFFHAVPDLLCIANIDGEFVRLNQAWETALGYRIEDLTGKRFMQLVHPDDVAATEQALATLGQQVKVERFTNRYRASDGSYRTLEWHSQPHGVLIYAVATDITERLRREEMALEHKRLTDSFQQARKQNEFIMQIIGTLSHDLRTPMSIIVSATDMLERYGDTWGVTRRIDKLESIRQQVAFAQDLLRDTVDIARGTLAPDSFKPRRVNVASLCQLSAEALQETTTAHDIIFINQGAVANAVIDELLVSRILLNLLTNAVKYSPDGGNIWLELDDDDEWLSLSVRDEGIGISAADQDKIFDIFYRSEVVSEHDGTGLGLSIVKNCVERHQGTLRVESVLGQGSTFMVHLPKLPNPDA